MRRGLLLALTALTAGCNAVVLQPSGDVALQQRNLIIIATVLMLFVIVPVIVLTLLFAWRYRASNTQATYKPDWHHSTQLELLIWAAPLLIIIMLGAVTWISTHTLDPTRPLSRLEAGKPLPPETKELKVQAVSLDWKWLFFYPELGIATVNELAAPVNVPISFQLTSSTVMNALYIPALAGQMYAMPGMESQLHAVINAPGEYEGFSANYSGAGFSDMRFRFHALSPADFEAWVAKVRSSADAFESAQYLELEKPSIRAPVQYFGKVQPGIYKAILNMCVDPTKMCMHDMLAIDEKGGLPMGSTANISYLRYDAPRARRFDGSRFEYVTALCAPEASDGTQSLIAAGR